MLTARFSKAFYLCNSFLLIVSPYSSRYRESVPISLTAKTEIKGDLLKSPSVFMKDNDPVPEASVVLPEIRLNDKEALFVRTYIRHRGDCLLNVKKRSIIPFYIIDSVFNQYHLPPELKYLSVVESELKTSAKSRVGARGPWQLMPATGRLLGLTINRREDERTNYYKSTRAAARYLKDLYVQFDDWLLVLAAYNGGPLPVMRAIHKSGSRDFWVLQKYLPRESRQHVRKFIATHYYFEGHGSETTLTRSEHLAYLEAVETMANQKNIPAAKLPKKETIPTIAPIESSEEKFKRVMRESEESLKNSGKLI